MSATNVLKRAVLAGFGLLEPAEEARRVPQGRILEQEAAESSGLAASRQQAGLWWTHNDSGHEAVLFPMSATGERLGAPVRVEGAVNRDWEDVAADGRGQLWIADLGNNLNMRRDLTVYVVEEPVAVGGVFPESVRVKRTLRVRYPDQDGFPPEAMNFDAEAVFVREQVLYVLAKHRSDTDTKLYRLEDDGGEAEQELTVVERFPGIGMVTAAALHPDGRRLAVLTYSGLWVFTSDGTDERFLSGAVLRMPSSYAAWGQVEGLDWLGEEVLVISNEQRDLFHVPLAELAPVGGEPE